MKKLLALILIVILCAFCLSSCDYLLKAVPREKKLHEHTYEYIAYDSGHFKQFTCGCPSPEIMGMHYDDDTDGICDACNYVMTGGLDHECYTYWYQDEQYHCLKSGCGCHGFPEFMEPHRDNDTDFICDICGYDMPLRVVNDILRNQAGCEWLNEITAEDIAEIKIISEAVGVAPGNLKNISRSTDEAVISRIFSDCYFGEVIAISKEKGEIDGGGAVTIKFILNDGTERKLYINNGNYRDVSGNYFELLCIPKFEDGDKVTKSCGFISYKGIGTVYDDNSNSICEIPIDALEFEYGLDLDLPDLEPYNMVVKTDFGDLDFISPDIFLTEGGEFCVLVGKDLNELISDSLKPDFTVTMNDPEWLYEELKPTYKAGETVVVKISAVTDTGYMFFVNGEQIIESDYSNRCWIFSFTMPESDVVIDFKTYDGFLPDYNYALLIETYWHLHFDADGIWVEHYYGEYASGAIVAYMVCDCCGYDDALWTERVGKVDFLYYNGHRIEVLYKGKFYTLTEAYENGYLTDDDILVIAEKYNNN